MAGPTVVVRVLGDLKGLASSFDSAKDKGTGAAKGMHEAFSGMLSALNQTGVLGPFGDALDGIDQALDQISKHAKDVGPAMMGVGAALAGVGVGLSTLGSKDQAAHQQLQAAVAATGKSYDDYEKQVDSAIKKQEKFGNTASDTQDALRVLTQATNDPAKAFQYLATASDLAAAKHESLTTAATTLGKAYNGNTKVLKEFGVAAGTTATQATKALEVATKGASTADQAAQAAKQHLLDLQARLTDSNKATAVSTAGVTAAQGRLADAQQHLSDLEAIDAGKKKLTISQQISLRNAHDAVTKATNGVATAQGKYSAAEAAAVAKTHLSVTQQQELRDAQAKVVDTAAKAKAAHEKLSAAQVAAGKSAQPQDDTMTALSNKLKGQASAAADTFGGKVKALRAHFEDSASELGQKYGPALTAVGTGMAGVGAAVTTTQGLIKTFTGASKDAKAAVDGVSDAEKGAQDASSLLAGASGIGLILVAVAALILIGYELYKHWNTIWSGIKKIVSDVWNWIKANWPLLLGILLGPFALAAALIYKYHTQILAAIQAVWTWIKANWPLLLEILTGPIGLAVRYVQQHWGAITAAFQGVLNWFRSTWSTVSSAITSPIQSAWSWILSSIHTVVSWFAGIPWEIGQAFGGLASIILSPFKAAFDAIARFWNNTVGSLSFKTPSWVPGLGGKGFSMPKIPVLAEGGLITQTGLIYAHAGEAITPAPAVARSGPAFVVQNAHFHNGLDIDTFMRKAAWQIKTQRV